MKKQISPAAAGIVIGVVLLIGIVVAVVSLNGGPSAIGGGPPLEPQPWSPPSNWAQDPGQAGGGATGAPSAAAGGEETTK